jgi:hypothetical protein
MTERTVTEQQVIKAIANAFKESLGEQCLQHSLTTGLLKELFPELPEVGELIRAFDSIAQDGVWEKFLHFTAAGAVCTYEGSVDNKSIRNRYRRQTAIERGEK